jgi:hypothetical protein
VRSTRRAWPGLGRHQIGLVDDDHVGELDLVDQQVDHGPLVVLAERERRGQVVVGLFPVGFRNVAASTTVTIVSRRASREALPLSSRR